MATIKERVCIPPPQLTRVQQVKAAKLAHDLFPANAPAGIGDIARLVVLSTKYWGDRVKDLTFGFMEPTSVAMRNKIDAYANRWGEFSKAKFRWTQTNPIIRISFRSGGYWSCLGTDCLGVPKRQQTMNLESFTVNTPDSEWERVVLHEFGHALGCPHEHQRREIINELDKAKVESWLMQSQGWSRDEVDQQVFVPLEESSFMSPYSPPDETSIMCYQFSGSVTKNGQPVLGGNTFSKMDKDFFSRIYPKDDAPVPPVPPTDKLTAQQAIDAIKAIMAKVA